jgi:tight adherence protein C
MSGALELLGALGLGCAAAGVARFALPPTARLGSRVRPYNHVGRAAHGLAPDVATSPLGGAFVGNFFAPLLQTWVRGASRRIESRSDGELETILFQAGMSDLGVEEFRVRQVARGVLGALAFGGFGALVLRVPAAALAFVVAGFVWGSSRVRAQIERAIEDRTNRIRLELATVAQLLALHVRTGAGPLQAVQRFADRGRGALADELRSVTVSVRAGSREADAFRRAADLTPAPEAARMHLLFANGVDRGADLAAALLVIADDLRDSRRDEIKRRAIKSRAAMLLPTIGILAPVMLLFIAAPLPSIVFGNR